MSRPIFDTEALADLISERIAAQVVASVAELMRSAKTPHAAPVPDWMDTPEAADYIGCSKQYMEGMRCRNEGPAYSKVGRLVRYHRPVLDTYLESRQQTFTHAQPKGARHGQK